MGSANDLVIESKKKIHSNNTVQFVKKENFLKNRELRKSSQLLPKPPQPPIQTITERKIKEKVVSAGLIQISSIDKYFNNFEAIP